MFETSKEVVRPYDFKTNILCMNAGFIEVEQYSIVVTEAKKGKTQFFQQMEEGSYNLMMEEEKLLNIAMENCEEERQPFKVVTEKEGGIGQSLMAIDNETNQEEGKTVRQTSSAVTVKEDQSFILIKDTEDCVEFSVTIPSELASLWEELMILEVRLRNQQKSIQDVKLELEKEDEEVVIAGNDEKNAEIYGEQGKSFMIGELNIFYDQSYADMENEEGKIVLKDNNEEQISVKQKYEVAEDNILEESYVSNDIKDEREKLLKAVM